jgi:hypothetical protein
MATVLLRGLPTIVRYGSIVFDVDGAMQSRVTGSALISLIASGSIKTSRTIHGQAIMRFVASGQITVPIAIAGNAIMSLSATGSIVSGADPLVTAWLMNTATGGHAQYNNFNYNSFFRIGADYYGCNDNGIYKLFGAMDVTTPISWDALSGVTNFGINTRKYVHNARMNVRAAGDVTLREIVDEQKSVSNAIAPSDDKNGVHAKRVKLPKGVHGTNWQFGLSGTDPATIRNFEVEPLATSRT